MCVPLIKFNLVSYCFSTSNSRYSLFHRTEPILLLSYYAPAPTRYSSSSPKLIAGCDCFAVFWLVIWFWLGFKKLLFYPKNSTRVTEYLNPLLPTTNGMYWLKVDLGICIEKFCCLYLLRILSAPNIHFFITSSIL